MHIQDSLKAILREDFPYGVLKSHSAGGGLPLNVEDFLGGILKQNSTGAAKAFELERLTLRILKEPLTIALVGNNHPLQVNPPPST